MKNAPTHRVVEVSTHGRIRVVTLNRPAQRNAISSELAYALCVSLREAELDERIDVVVVTGAGDAFCAGLDLKEAASRGEAFFETLREDDPINLTAALSKPTIAAVNGPAITGGLELALNCDFIVASSAASFADTHSRVGVVPGGGLTVRLPRLVGHANAKAMSLTGKVLDADEAARFGLVFEVVSPDTLVDRTLELASMISSADGPTTREIKRVYDSGALGTDGDALAAEASASVRWRIGFEELDSRRREVTATNRGQLAPSRDGAAVDENSASAGSD